MHLKTDIKDRFQSFCFTRKLKSFGLIETFENTEKMNLLFILILFLIGIQTHAYQTQEISPAFEADLPTAIQKASRAVWMLNGKEEKVSVHKSGPVTSTSTIITSRGGSSFSFKPRLIATNFHVMDSLLKVGLSNIILSQKGVESELKITRLFALSAVADIAILETDEEAPYLNLRIVYPFYSN